MRTLIEVCKFIIGTRKIRAEKKYTNFEAEGKKWNKEEKESDKKEKLEDKQGQNYINNIIDENNQINKKDTKKIEKSKEQTENTVDNKIKFESVIKKEPKDEDNKWDEIKNKQGENKIVAEEDSSNQINKTSSSVNVNSTEEIKYGQTSSSNKRKKKKKHKNRTTDKSENLGQKINEPKDLAIENPIKNEVLDKNESLNKKIDKTDLQEQNVNDINSNNNVLYKGYVKYRNISQNSDTKIEDNSKIDNGDSTSDKKKVEYVESKEESAKRFWRAINRDAFDNITFCLGYFFECVLQDEIIYHQFMGFKSTNYKDCCLAISNLVVKVFNNCESKIGFYDEGREQSKCILEHMTNTERGAKALVEFLENQYSKTEKTVDKSEVENNFSEEFSPFSFEVVEESEKTEETYAKLKTRLDELNTKLKESIQNSYELKKQNNELKSNNKKMKKIKKYEEAEDRKKEIGILKNENNELKQESKMVRRKYLGSISELMKPINAIVSAVGIIQDIKSEESEEVKEVENSKISTAKLITQSTANLIGKLTEIKNGVQQLKNKTRNSKKEKNDSIKKQENLETEIDKIAKDNKDLKSNIDLLELTDLKNKIAEYEKQTERSASENKDLRKKVNTLELENSSLKEKLDKDRNTDESYANKLNDLKSVQKELESLKKEKENLSKEIETLKNSKNKNSLNDILKTTEVEKFRIKSQKNEISNLKNQNETEKIDSESLILTQKLKNIEDLINANSNSKKDMENLSNENKKLKEEVNDLRLKLREMKCFYETKGNDFIDIIKVLEKKTRDLVSSDDKRKPDFNISNENNSGLFENPLKTEKNYLAFKSNNNKSNNK